MKKLAYFLSALALLSVGACSEDFLETKKIGEQTVETFYNTDQQAIQAANAAYSSLWDYRYVSSAYPLGDITTSDAVKGSEPGDLADFAEMGNFNVLPSNLVVSWRYPRIWQGIFKANQVIYNLDGKEKPEMTPALQKRVVAEAKFVRALFYFDAVRTWGKLPLILAPLQLDEMEQSQASTKDIYAQIEKDLKEAEADLPLKSQYAAADAGRATKGAAQALLAKVCIYQASEGYKDQDFYNAAKWAEAKTWAEKLFTSNEYSLYQGYFGDIFDEMGENNSESIFEIQFTETAIVASAFTNNGNFATVLTSPRGPWGWGLMQPTYDMYAAFEPGDPRRDATIITTNAYLDEEKAHGAPADVKVNDDQTGLHNLKNYLKPNERPKADYRNSPVNERLIRLSDLYLLYAEACYHTNDEPKARQYLNLVRERARQGNPAILPDVTASGEALIAAIRQERRVELAFEHHRYYDLTRWGLLEKVIKTDGYVVDAVVTGTPGNYVVSPGEKFARITNYDPVKHRVLPFPQSEIDFNNGRIVQNPGY